AVSAPRPRRGGSCRTRSTSRWRSAPRRSRGAPGRSRSSSAKGSTLSSFRRGTPARSRRPSRTSPATPPAGPESGARAARRSRSKRPPSGSARSSWKRLAGFARRPRPRWGDEAGGLSPRAARRLGDSVARGRAPGDRADAPPARDGGRPPPRGSKAKRARGAGGRRAIRGSPRSDAWHLGSRVGPRDRPASPRAPSSRRPLARREGARARRSDLRFWIAGEGPLRAELEAEHRALKLGDSVRFLGFRDDATDLLRAADLFVMSSYLEGLGTSILDAMAGGLAVVATRVGGIPEVVEHQGTGILVPPRDPEALAAAILELAGDPARRAAMGASGRERA